MYIIAEYDHSCGQIIVSVPNIKPSVLGLKELLKDTRNGDFDHKLLGFNAGRDIRGKDVFCSLAYNSQNYVIAGENDEERDLLLKGDNHKSLVFVFAEGNAVYFYKS